MAKTRSWSSASISGRLLGGEDPAGDSGYAEHPPRVGFFTDTSLCIGCKACEVACKEWNQVPEDGLNFTGMSFDNSAGLSADTWRHVAFIEQPRPLAGQQTGGRRPGHSSNFGDQDDAPYLGARGAAESSADANHPSSRGTAELRWLMASDVCKHCTHAACLDVCPTGALLRTEFGTVVVQEDVCNGCGYCVPACPYGVIAQRQGDGRVWKCTLCYDRLRAGTEPACAKACPTESIQFGPLDELRDRATARLADMHASGIDEARLYGEDPRDGVGGAGAFFLLLDDPEVYGLPPAPVVTTRDLPAMWARAGIAAVGLAVAVAGTFLGQRT